MHMPWSYTVADYLVSQSGSPLTHDALTDEWKNRGRKLKKACGEGRIRGSWGEAGQTSIEKYTHSHTFTYIHTPCAALGVILMTSITKMSVADPSKESQEEDVDAEIHSHGLTHLYYEHIHMSKRCVTHTGVPTFARMAVKLTQSFPSMLWVNICLSQIKELSWPLKNWSHIKGKKEKKERNRRCQLYPLNIIIERL